MVWVCFFFALVKVACKMTMSREYQMETMERRAQACPAGPIHTCSLPGTQTRLHTHPTPRPARPERKAALLLSHNQSKRAEKAPKTKGPSAGRVGWGDILGNCWKGKVDKQAFMMHLLVLMTRNQANYFSFYS